MAHQCTKHCKQCNAEFTVRPSRDKRSKYCSMACYNLNKSPAVDDRFWAQVDKSDLDGCWIWKGSRAGGYGKMSVRGVTVGAHRISYELAKGQIECGLIVLHSCDTPLCVNPDHLRAGTYKENTQDMLDRNRGDRSEETRMKISAALVGKKKSPEARAKYSSIARARDPARMALAVTAISHAVEYRGQRFASKSELRRHLGGVHSRVIDRMIASGEATEC